MRKRSGRFADDQIIEMVRNELQQILGPQISGLRAEPLFARVYKWKSAMAQYGVGHLDRLDRMERLRQQATRPGARGQRLPRHRSARIVSVRVAMQRSNS